MTELVLPHVRFHASFLAAHREWAGAHEDGAGLTADDQVESTEEFARWVSTLESQETRPRRPVGVTCTYRWIVDGGSYLGSIALRHDLNDDLVERGGHIGYGVRPSARGRGLGAWALGRTLPLALGLGLHRVLLTCGEGNVASARTIERCGGVLEDVRLDRSGESVRRYWIELTTGG